jgi:activator of HSP90 ATPase
MSTPIHQEIMFSAAPQRVYDVLLDARQFSELTGGAGAAIDAQVGGAFSCFGGMITGRNIELQAGRRIVQAWRVGNWPEGVYSIVHFELTAIGAGSKLTFSHSGFPDGTREHLDAGWHRMYWEPLAKYLASG